ncbi:MAG: nitroreductase family protein [Rikenellaceae bacterium]|jgi:nitroreductase|nr:nitroreductase family protein [Rikenellaceae bacterium]
MALKEIVMKNRSCRRFRQERRVSRELLVSLVELARLTASGRNLQVLKYAVVNDPAECATLYPALAWAGYLKEWDGPEEGECPSAYIVLCCDTSIGPENKWDEGIAAQTILLGAVEAGLGGCMIGSIRREEIVRTLGLSENLTPVLVIALGVPKEEAAIVPLRDGDIKYYRDEQSVHYVPKRSLDDILIK